MKSLILWKFILSLVLVTHPSCGSQSADGASPTRLAKLDESYTQQRLSPESKGTGAGKHQRKASGGSPGNSELGPPDVHLRVPSLSVGRIQLEVDNLQAHVSLSANVANLVTINAGVDVGVQKVNITIVDVGAQLDLLIRLGNLVNIVNRTLASLDLNPALVGVLNQVGNVASSAVGSAGNMLSSTLKSASGGKSALFVNNKGEIVEETTNSDGGHSSTIVGDYQHNMTYTGREHALHDDCVERTYQYAELGSLVNIVFDSSGKVIRSTVVKESEPQNHE